MTKKLWGGRFKAGQDQAFWKFQASLEYDKELAYYDVKGSIAHVQMLDKCGIIPKKAARSIINGLTKLLNDIEKGRFKPDPEAEDIHTAVYMALSKSIGKGADYLHTARSRNDQVVLDLRMYCKDKVFALGKGTLPSASKLRIKVTVVTGDNRLHVAGRAVNICGVGGMLSDRRRWGRRRAALGMAIGTFRAGRF